MDYWWKTDYRLKEKNISISKAECQRILNSKSNNYYDVHIITSEKDGKEVVKTYKYKIENDYLRIYEFTNNEELKEIDLK